MTITSDENDVMADAQSLPNNQLDVSSNKLDALMECINALPTREDICLIDWESENLPKQFRSFKRYCELILSTPTYASQTGKEVAKYILLWMGPQAVEIYDNWTHLTDEQKETPTEVWESFRTYFEPRTNFRLSRFQLRELGQQVNEPIDSYITRLKVQAQKCNFDNQATLEDNLINQVIKGVVHGVVRKTLLNLNPNTLTLDRVIGYARTHEATQTQLQQLGQPASVDAVQRNRVQDSTYSRPKHICNFCGGSKHPREECPASGQECKKSHKKGHWGIVCRSTQVRNQLQHRGRYQHKYQNRQQRTYNRSRSSSRGRRHPPEHVQRVNEVRCDPYLANLPTDFEELTFNSPGKH